MSLVPLLALAFHSSAVDAEHSVGNATLGATSEAIYREPVTPIPVPDKQLASAKSELGRLLFFDRKLSAKGDRACASCHLLPAISPDMTGQLAQPELRETSRNINPLLNLESTFWFGWDGRHNALKPLVAESFQDAGKLGNTRAQLALYLGSEANYQERFQAVYQQAPTLLNAADALTDFLRRQSTPDSRFDQFLRGNSSALNDEEQAGYALFKEVGCISCHNGTLLGGNFLEKARVFETQEQTLESTFQDKGRYLFTGDLDDINVFRVPPLRNIALTSPYFHDGSVQNLSSAVAIMANSLLGVELSQEDIRKIELFLRTLTGRYAGVTE